MDSLLGNLNEKQKRAVEYPATAQLVLAGAGTGKTKVLTTRIAYVLNKGDAEPWQIMALTFTNKAANEMKKRLSGMSSGAWFSGDVWCGTFHSICLRILRANATRLGMRRNFIIYDEDDQKSVIKSLKSESAKTPSEYVEEFSKIKDKGLVALKNTDKMFNAYNAELARLNAVDFGDIILRVLELFDKNPDILSRYQNQFRYILVDEFQDVNDAQMELIKKLMPTDRELRGERYLFCVGDDDQSIYSWRGAEIKHILDFEKDYDDTSIIIDTNYRSTANILNAANSLIAHNNNRYTKALKPCPANLMGEPVYVLTLPSDYDEVRIIADFIQRDETPDFSKFAVLIRTGSLSRLFEEEFGRRQIPYKLVGATKFYDRIEIRDVIAYLRLLAYPFDDMSFLRIIGKPSRQIGPKAIEKIKQSGPNLMAGLRGATLTAKQRAAADEFLSAFDFDWASMSPRDATKSLLDRVGYLKYWHESKDTNAQERLSNINELINGVIAKYDTVADFLEHAALMTADDNDAEIIGNVVSIMTIHAAKGLEFDTVFLPAWEENIFPNDKTVSEGAIEEERRLAYVAITRARRMCVISNAMSRVIFGQRQYNCPSRFITEIDNRYLDFQGGAPRARTYYATPQRPTYDMPPKPRPTPVQNNTLKGKFVTHSEMGSGVVIEDDGNILTVAFKNRGIKKVARQFVTVS